VTFDGDLFAMEDQRNWTDASYKTYCTPLEMPFPVEVAKGARIRQSVALRLNMASVVAPAAGPTTHTPRPAPVTLTVDLAALCPLPKIGLAVASHGRPLGDRQIERLRALKLDHLRVDLPLGQTGWRQRLEQAAMQAQRLGVSLQAAITLADDAEAELTALTAECKRLRPPVADWLIFHAKEKTASRRWIGLATEILRMGGCLGRIVSGTNAYFAELNRNRPPVEVCEAICYSLNPQVHAFDNASLTETLPAQAYTVESARQFAAGRPILVTPVTLRPRFNPNATGPEEPTPPGQLPSQVDPRQPTLFAAAWTLGSIRYLTAAGADSVTYYETTGWCGVMELEEGCLLSDRFPSIPGGVFPLYHVLADVGGFARGSAAAVQSSDPLKVEGLALADGKRCRLLVGNFTAARQNVVIRMPGGSNVRVATMAPLNVELAMSKPEEFRRDKGEPMDAADGRLKLDLPPEGILRLDAVVKE
jgi:hypothetical protein